MVVATPQGRGVVLAKVVVDATGNADLAASAGVPCKYTDASELAMQGTGLPSRQLGATYTNTDFTITDDTDMVDVWQMLVHAKHKYPEAFDQGQLIDTRSDDASSAISPSPSSTRSTGEPIPTPFARPWAAATIRTATRSIPT